MRLEQKMPERFLALWEKCLPIFEECRPGDVEHALAGVDFIINYRGNLKLDFDVLIPMAIMHDIGHSAILPEHFSYITGTKRIKNAKLVHMLTGAKIARIVLTSINYDAKKTAEIVDIISMHDADQLEEFSLEEVYNTENKRAFHDLISGVYVGIILISINLFIITQKGINQLIGAIWFVLSFFIIV